MKVRRCGGSSRRGIALLAGLVILSLLSGCASRKQVFVMQDELRYVSANVDTLKRQQQQVQESVCSLDEQVRTMSATSEYGSSSLAEKVETLAARLDEILNRMDRSLAPLEEFMRRQGISDSTAGGSSMGVDYYDAAMRDLSLGNYDLAEVGFLQFLQNYPTSDLADDARYGLAETYYARKQYEMAVEEFRRVVNENPHGSKSPSALLKIGLCYRAQSDNRQAVKAWEELIKTFPYSEEAKVAAQRLDEIKGGR